MRGNLCLNGVRKMVNGLPLKQTFACVATLLTATVVMPSVQAKSHAPHNEVVNVLITDHGFSPNRLIEPLDTPLHLHIQNVGKQQHEFAIPEYRIYTRTLGPGETSDVEFSPWESGTFTMYSDPVADSQPEFTGQFIVKDKMSKGR